MKKVLSKAIAAGMVVSIVAANGVAVNAEDQTYNIGI